MERNKKYKIVHTCLHEIKKLQSQNKKVHIIKDLALTKYDAERNCLYMLIQVIVRQCSNTPGKHCYIPAAVSTVCVALSM